MVIFFDNFQDVVTYSILREQSQGSTTLNTPVDYFFMDSTTGEIFLRRSVENTGINSFNVSFNLYFIINPL